MGGIISVELTNLRFYAAHGLHEEEAILGNEFEVNIFLTVPVPEKTITSIDETINYVAVYEIVQREMNESKRLLETCAMLIEEQLHKRFPKIKGIKINIVKTTPPIRGFIGSVGITLSKEY